MSSSDKESHAHRLLLARASRGDKEGLREIYRRFGKIAYSISFKILGSSQDAEECTQDAFMSLWQHAGELVDTPEKLGPWLIRTVRNRSIDRIRKANRRLPSTQKVQSDPERGEVETRDDQAPTALEQLVKSEQAERIRAALQQLPPEQRTVIRLAYFKGMTQSQIADSLNEALGTIKSRIRYAVQRLRKEMEGSHVS